MPALATHTFTRNEDGEDFEAQLNNNIGTVRLCAFELMRLWDIPAKARSVTVEVSTRRNRDAYAVVPHATHHTDDNPCYVVLARFRGDVQPTTVHMDFGLSLFLHEVFQNAKNPKALWVSVTTP